ncbi:glycine--tRNA ligase [Candidatus Daviesbacteria bacterium]|nr:glycine--tRNA ligase [Candidatus Daviesbacteria bacterium]
MNNNLMEKVVALCKRRGFIFPGSQIYGGLANSWDYGPLGVELKNNIKQAWWKRFVHLREDVLGIDAALIMNPLVWEASGHVANFQDPLIECKKCHQRYRVDYIKDKICPNCGGKDSFTDEKMFNLMFKTFIGPAEEQTNTAYFRPETAQAMFVDFRNVVDTQRLRLPFGIAQIGKAFRNEITPGNFIFRTREFEQMEIEYFIPPPKSEKDWQGPFEVWRKEILAWTANDLGVGLEKIHEHEIPASQRAHYSKRTIDFEYDFPFGVSELYGLAYRTDFDLANHERYSGQNLKYRDPDTGEEFIPHVIEPTWGVDRSVLVVLIDSYTEDQGRVILKLPPKLAPIKVAVFPLLANKPDLVGKAKGIYQDLKHQFTVAWDDRGNIGKRYASQDEIGTPFCITVDFQSLEDEAVTIRDRDSAKQERVKIVDLKTHFFGKIEVE